MVERGGTSTAEQGNPLSMRQLIHRVEESFARESNPLISHPTLSSAHLMWLCRRRGHFLPLHPASAASTPIRAQSRDPEPRSDCSAPLPARVGIRGRQGRPQGALRSRRPRAGSRTAPADPCPPCPRGSHRDRRLIARAGRPSARPREPRRSSGTAHCRPLRPPPSEAQTDWCALAACGRASCPPPVGPLPRWPRRCLAARRRRLGWPAGHAGRRCGGPRLARRLGGGHVRHSPARRSRCDRRSRGSSRAPCAPRGGGAGEGPRRACRAGGSRCGRMAGC